MYTMSRPARLPGEADAALARALPRVRWRALTVAARGPTL
jgi:hypothetical protein